MTINNSPSNRFDLLDGARGVAALAVMLYHFTNRSDLKWMMGAWVAVDLFFILSGFVIALSYGRRLKAGMTFVEFAKLRLLRLAPLYLVGLLLGYVGMLLASRAAEATITAEQATTALLLGIAGLPWFNSMAWPFDGNSITGAFYPLNDPSWSLAFEMIANAVFFCWIARFRTLSSASLVAAAMGLFIAGSLALWQFNPGFGQVNYVLGFPRVIGEFFMGTLIFELGLHRRRYAFSAVAGIAIVGLILMAQEKRTFAIINGWLVIPFVVPLLASVQVRRRTWQRLCSTLGELSYPIYVLHVPVCRLTHELLPMNGMTPVSKVAMTALIAIVVAAILANLDMRWRLMMSNRATWKLSRRKQPTRDSGVATLS